ncbi:MAG TPA: hypothetical protein VM689_00500 [Aliidongia sp.]|nr:hypothetical protein [Aliidongia sp.]
MSSNTDLESLIAATEHRLNEALDQIGAGQLVDLADLPQRIALICSRAVAERNKAAADRLKRLVERLDVLGQALRTQIINLGGVTTPDPRQAAKSYGAAAARRQETDE